MTVVVASSPMRDLLRQTQKVAQSSAAVLITGESGSGKEVIARALHHYSPRASKPWVDVNCAALPEHLVESELFGYEKGAFSGADSAKTGLFELASNGTLYLDEVGELEPKVQVKLLRVLDNVPYYRLGGTRKISVDVRVIAATNQPLDALIKTGRFRNDLYHRLRQVSLHVPPLRHRVQDIEPLATFLLRQHDPSLMLAADAIEALERHTWPGNVRELRNVITQAAVLADGKRLRAYDLALSMTGSFHSPEASFSSSLEAMEKQMVFKALEQTGGRHGKAAELLGISRRTLSRKLKLYEEDNATENLVR
jgi:DNA-binding NtrC family response regulator